MTTEAPYGAWISPITTGMITGKRIGVADPSFDGADVLWLESRPGEGGRSAVVRRRPDGSTADAVPEAANVRTRVHEYGGGAVAAEDGVLIFAHFHDTRLYRVERDGKTRPITPETALRYADFVFDTPRNRLLPNHSCHCSTC